MSPQYVVKYTIHLLDNRVIPIGYQITDDEYKLVAAAGQLDRVVLEGVLPYFQLSDSEIEAEMAKYAEELARRSLSVASQKTGQVSETQNLEALPQDIKPKPQGKNR